jgi:hypothetical protein
MFGYKGILIILGAPLLWVAAGSGEQTPPAGISTPRSIHLNVVVTRKSGQPVTDLQQRDFAIFDNNSTRSIRSFAAVIIKPKSPEVTAPLKFAGEASDAGTDDPWELFQYEITFDAPCAERANEYHQVEVKVYKPNLIVRARQGYFAQADQICRT